MYIYIFNLRKIVLHFNWIFAG